MLIYARLEALRKAKGISQTYIAQALKRKSTIFNDWKNNKSTPNEAQLRIVSDMLDTTPEYLTGKTDVKEKPTPGNGSGQDDSMTDTERYIMQTARRLRPDQQVLLLELLQTVLRSNQQVGQQLAP